MVGVAGIIISFLLCGFIAIAGKRGSAPTMVLSRAAFGVRGNKLPTAISWLLTVGWETILMILATLAIATVFGHLGWPSGTATKVIAMIVVVGLTIFGGVMGFDLIMRMQTAITIVTGVLTVMFIILVAGKIHWSAVIGAAGRLGAGADRRAGVHDDRLRARLGQRGRRLLALPAAEVVRAPGWPAGRPSAARWPRSS